MSEFDRQQGLICAAFAVHAWRLLKQYETLTRDLHPAQRYEATLTVCVLQALSTNCWALYEHLEQRSSEVLGALDTFVDSLLREPEVHVTSTFEDIEPSARAVLRSIRNAPSHPRMKVTDPPTTGYTTVKDPSGLVTTMRLVASPDLDSNGNLEPRARRRTGGNLQRARVFTIELPLGRLTALAEEMALVLAQPTVENWDNEELLPLK